VAVGTAVDSTMVSLVSTLNSWLQKNIEPNVYDQIFKHNAVLYRFYKKGKVMDGGAALTWPVLRTKKQYGGFYTGAQQLAHGQEDTVEPAEVVWRHLYEDITIPRTDIIKSTSKYAAVNLVRFKFDEALINCRDRLADSLFTTTTLGLDHLRMAIDDGTDFTSYAGIAHSNAFWKPGINGDGRYNVGGPATLSDIQSGYSRATDGDEQPSLIIATQKGNDFLWGQLQALQRYAADDEMVRAGFTEAFKFNRSTVVVDRRLPANEMIFVNERWLDLITHEKEDFIIDPIIPGTPSERSLNTKLAWTGNLRVKSIRYHSRLVGATNFALLISCLSYAAQFFSMWTV
jgi:hypothetical protein